MSELVLDPSRKKPSYLLQAAGIGYRWHNHLGVRKHKIVIDGEPLIDRTVRQLAERGCDTIIIARAGEPGYKFPTASTFVPKKPSVTDTQIDTFLSSKPVWNTDGPTVLMYGDVWWTDEAIDTVTSYDGTDPWHIWYRPGASKVNGCGHGEIFAHRFNADLHAAEEAALRRVQDLHRRDILPWMNTGGWAIYRAMLGLPDDQVHGYGTPDFDHASLIDDWTDDFDAPFDYIAWYGRRTIGRYPARIVFDGTSQEVRSSWPTLDSATPAVTITVHGDLTISPEQVWCGIAHAVEHQVSVIPYSHATNTQRWVLEPMWTAHESDRRIIVTPTGRPSDDNPVRLYGHCWDRNA
jgi:hypothetical protein